MNLKIKETIVLEIFYTFRTISFDKIYSTFFITKISNYSYGWAKYEF